MFLSLYFKTNIRTNKIFTTVSSTAFVHMQRYNEDKMKAPLRDSKWSFSLVPITTENSHFEFEGFLLLQERATQ